MSHGVRGSYQSPLVDRLGARAETAYNRVMISFDLAVSGDPA